MAPKRLALKEEKGNAEDVVGVPFRYTRLEALGAFALRPCEVLRPGMTQLFDDTRDGLRKIDLPEAVAWYRRAAEQGNSRAQVNLGFMYEFGAGVKPEYVQAYFWYGLAAEQGFAVALDRRDTVAERMTRDQIAEAQRLAREWQPKAE